MISKVYYKVGFTEEEAIALKKVLGKNSDVHYEECGLNSNGISTMHELYDLLPFDNEED